MSRPFAITSRLGDEHRAALEELLFFNRLQSAVRTRIVATIERYGMPKVVARDRLLRIELDGVAEVQSLFALAPTGSSPGPIGVAVFLREGEERFVIVHVGVAEQFSATGERASDHVFFHLLNAIRDAARRTRGVRSIDLFYGQGVVRHIPVQGVTAS
ncbi:MAG TPA: hypothetical protein VJ764_03040 [Steroidobacteraceae bacterium]|nr:hypothetical protein [Steroidobacteraceae bacterium]